MLIPYDPEWYLKQIAKHGVSHPAAGGYTINPGVRYPEAKNYSDSRQGCIDYQADIFRRLSFRLEGQRVLEFGCGNLMTHDSLLRYGLDSSNYVGVELIKEFRDYGAERGIKVVETVKESDPMVSSGLAFSYVFVVELYCQFVDERGVISHLRKMASYARLGLIDRKSVG